MPKRSGRKRGSNAYNPIDVHVGNRLRARRTLLGLTQTTLAEAIGLTFQQMQKYEKGSNRITASRLYDLSQILDVDIGYFFDDMGGTIAKASPAQISQREAAKFAKAPGRSEDPLHKRETLELVRAYYRITDPTIRTHVRKLVQSTASASNPST
jgi:transcriptional regulator with XRE-family HTH domain